jgi:hypothetical protein
MSGISCSSRIQSSLSSKAGRFCCCLPFTPLGYNCCVTRSLAGHRTVRHRWPRNMPATACAMAAFAARSACVGAKELAASEHHCGGIRRKNRTGY